jgi:hypothetical protein
MSPPRPDARITSPETALQLARELAPRRNRFPADRLPELEEEARFAAWLALEVVTAEAARAACARNVEEAAKKLPAEPLEVDPRLQRARERAGIKEDQRVMVGVSVAEDPVKVHQDLHVLRVRFEALSRELKRLVLTPTPGSEGALTTLFAADLILRLSRKGLVPPSPAIFGLLAQAYELDRIVEELDPKARRWAKTVERATQHVQHASELALRDRDSTEPLRFEELEAALFKTFL